MENNRRHATQLQLEQEESFGVANEAEKWNATPTVEHCSLGDSGKEEETSTGGGATICVEFESVCVCMGVKSRQT